MEKTLLFFPIFFVTALWNYGQARTLGKEINYSVANGVETRIKEIERQVENLKRELQNKKYTGKQIGFVLFDSICICLILSFFLKIIVISIR